MGATAEMLEACAANIQEAEDWAQELVDQIGTPICWHRRDRPVLAYYKIGDNLMVLWSARREADGKRWIHVSYSRPSKDPSWEDTCEVKRTFIGKDRKAISVMPAEAEYVNIHPHCLHLWACLDGDGLPDFRVMGMI